MINKNIAIGIAGVSLVAVLSVAAFWDKFPSFSKLTHVVGAEQVVLPPTVNEQFVAIVEHTKRQYIDSRGNSLGLREARAAAICAMGFPRAQALDWSGRLVAASSTASGLGVIRIEIAPGVHVSTRSTYLTDTLDNSLIPVCSPVATSVSQIPLGSRVRFSGVFVADSTDCIRESSITNEQAVRSPNFIMRFSAVSKLQ